MRVCQTRQFPSALQISNHKNRQGCATPQFVRRSTDIHLSSISKDHNPTRYACRVLPVGHSQRSAGICSPPDFSSKSAFKITSLRILRTRAATNFRTHYTTTRYIFTKQSRSLLHQLTIIWFKTSDQISTSEIEQTFCLRTKDRNASAGRRTRWS